MGKSRSYLISLFVSMVLVLSSLLMLTVTEAMSYPLNVYSGTWVNPDKNTNGVTKLDIKVDRGTGKVTVKVWGKCQPTDCYWGVANGLAFTDNVSGNPKQVTKGILAIYTPNFATRYLIIKLRDRNTLSLEVFTHFRDSSTRKDYYKSYILKRDNAITLSREDCVRFNPNRVEVKMVNNRWKIVDGNVWLFDFGRNYREALRSLQIIKHYKMDQICYIGRPFSSFKYLLSSGKAPSGSLPGEDCVSFNPQNLQVKHINNRWKIVDGNVWLFDFGPSRNQAIQALNVIEKYGFREVCYVGRPKASFTYLKR